MDKTYTFTRGIDTFVVTVNGREARRAKIHASAFYPVFIVITLVLGMAILPLLILPIVLTFAMIGKLQSIDEGLRDIAEGRAKQTLASMESERWRAARALKD